MYKVIVNNLLKEDTIYKKGDLIKLSKQEAQKLIKDGKVEEHNEKEELTQNPSM